MNNFTNSICRIKTLYHRLTPVALKKPADIFFLFHFHDIRLLICQQFLTLSVLKYFRLCGCCMNLHFYGGFIMAMELLFENHTQLDEDVIHHIIEKDYKRPEKAKQYHVMTLLVGILAALAAVYFGRLGILTPQMLTLLCTIALIAVCIYSFYSYYQNMPKNQIKARQNTYSESLLIPRKMKVYKNVMYQSAGKSHGEYRLFQFTGIETWSHYFLLRYENSYVVMDKNGFTKGTAEEFEQFMTARIQKNC